MLSSVQARNNIVGLSLLSFVAGVYYYTSRVANRDEFAQFDKELERQQQEDRQKTNRGKMQ
eukprot:scaffold7243_cov394-Prasinococcus_capsulatus_cf.AAC.19